MSVGPHTSRLLKTTVGQARHQAITASYSALVQACDASGEQSDGAELVDESPRPLWSLPGSGAYAVVHTDPDEARALLWSAHLLEEHQVPVVVPEYRHPLRGGGRDVTVWHRPGPRYSGRSVGAWASAAVHRIQPDAGQLRDHDPFDGLLDGLADAPLLRADRDVLRLRADRLREQWTSIDWPTPPTVILGDLGAARCHGAGTTLPRLLLRRPLLRGHLEWDLAAARWRTDMLAGHLHDHDGYAEAYATHTDRNLPYGSIDRWEHYPLVRDLVVLTDVMHTVRRAHLDSRTRQLAAHQSACLRGLVARPWPWKVR
ncbi:hypothetical protein [Kitasatospora sp. NPDC088779]|uniref:hypothetical protein n=1 Tax=Kitasatospora sp. NPDC088779 TaxID=3154964 RepID=UPI003445092A